MFTISQILLQSILFCEKSNKLQAKRQQICKFLKMFTLSISDEKLKLI